MKKKHSKAQQENENNGHSFDARPDTERPPSNEALINPGRVIRDRRKVLGFKAIEVARTAGVNPRTLDAIEKERIKTPSLPILASLAELLGISVASLFSDTRPQAKQVFHLGDQKGLHTLEFPRNGFRVMCYTPLARDCFIGKVVVNAETRIAHEVFPTSGTIFVQPIIGKLSVQFDGTDHLIREGNYAFFDGHFPHSYFNPQLKESSFLIVTVPSFLSRAGLH